MSLVHTSGQRSLRVFGKIPEGTGPGVFGIRENTEENNMNELAWNSIVKSGITAILFTTMGLVMFALAFMIIKAVSPFSLRKEIEEDQNIALGILMGAMMLGLSIIIAAAIHS